MSSRRLMLRRAFGWMGPLSLLVAAALSATAGEAQAEAPPSFILSWGSTGTGDGQFAITSGIVAGPGSDVYVADAYNYRIQDFTRTGQFLRKWGSRGTGDGMFTAVGSLDVDGAGNVFAADYFTGRIEVFAPDGAFLRSWTLPSPSAPASIAVDRVNQLVYATSNFNVFKFALDGTLLSTWNAGTADLHPLSIAIGPSGNIYIASQKDGFVRRYSPDGHVLLQWGHVGTGDGEFVTPYDIAVDGAENVYVCDYGSHRIEKFTSGGTFLTQWGTYGTGDGQFIAPTGIAVDSDGSVYVIDGGSVRVQKFGDIGTPTSVTSWGRVKALYR